MIGKKLFRRLTSEGIARKISLAKHSVCYAAPGIQEVVAKAIVDLAERIKPEKNIVCLDFDERVMRMGFGDDPPIPAIKILQVGGISIFRKTGLRMGFLIVDLEGYVFAPTALYLEKEGSAAESHNAMRLSKEQVAEALARFSPHDRPFDAFRTDADKERDRATEDEIETSSSMEEPDEEELDMNDVDLEEEQPKKVTPQEIDEVDRQLKDSPPIPFDLARQERVYKAYLQYVKLTFAGAKIQQRKYTIPSSIHSSIQNMDDELKKRFKTTFDLFDDETKISSKSLNDQLNEIRKRFTRSLGSGQDSDVVILKSDKEEFLECLERFRNELKKHQVAVIFELENELGQSRQKIIDYYAQIIADNPPKDMGNCRKGDVKAARIWIDRKLDGDFPKAESLVSDMKLTDRYSDITFETLNEEEFLEAVKKAFPDKKELWEKAHEEYLAAREGK